MSDITLQPTPETDYWSKQPSADGTGGITWKEAYLLFKINIENEIGEQDEKIATLTAERDAAIRERDEARAELAKFTTIHPPNQTHK